MHFCSIISAATEELQTNKYKAHVKILCFIRVMYFDNFLDEKFKIKCKHVVTDWYSIYSNTVDINVAIKTAI
jgi:hypothetical protein